MSGLNKPLWLVLTSPCVCESAICTCRPVIRTRTVLYQMNAHYCGASSCITWHDWWLSSECDWASTTSDHKTKNNKLPRNGPSINTHHTCLLHWIECYSTELTRRERQEKQPSYILWCCDIPRDHIATTSQMLM